MLRKQAVWRCSYLPPPVRSDGVHRRQVWRADAAGQRAGRDQANLLAVLIVSDGPLWPSPLLHLAETQHNHVTRKEKKRKHCDWHFSVSHYLLVLRFDRFPQWPSFCSSSVPHSVAPLHFALTSLTLLPLSLPSSLSLSFLLSLTFSPHRVTVHVCPFLSTKPFIFYSLVSTPPSSPPLLALRWSSLGAAARPSDFVSSV